MIPLVLAMLWVRRGQALTLALLAMFGTAAAVAAPGYVQAVDRGVVAHELATASPDERIVTIGVSSNKRAQGNGLDFTSVGAAMLGLPGFSQVYAEEYPILGLEPLPHAGSRLVYRKDICGHLVIHSGRCLVGEGEVLVGAAAAQRLGLRPGDSVTASFASVSTDPNNPVLVPDGVPTPLTIAGTYTVPRPNDLYWGTHGYFALDPVGKPSEPVFTDAATVTSIDHGATQESIEATASPASFDPSRLRLLPGELDDLNGQLAALGASVSIGTSMPKLLERISAERTLAHQIVPVAAVPLVLLAWFVIFLAVGYGTEDHRAELGLTALRGTRLAGRWWLSSGENVLAILLGALLGALAGPLAVAALAGWRLPGVSTPLVAPGLAGYALAATLGAVLAAGLAQWRAVASPVLELLRRVPAAPRWRSLTVEVVIVALAAVVVVQLRVSGGVLRGVGLLAPALVILALAVIGSRAVLWLVLALARRALRRGWPGAALAAFGLARRPGVQRLFLLLVAAVALLDFAAGAVNVAGRDVAIRAQVNSGAPRVLSVGALSRSQLLHAVRAADPAGHYAMAVAELPPGAPGETPKLAVDATRLATAATWPAGSGELTAGQVATRLRPPAPDPVLLPGQDLALDVTVAGALDSTPLSLSAVLSSVHGHGTATPSFGVLRNGTQTYQQRIPNCLDGCRLAGLQISSNSSAAVSFTLRLTLRGLRTTSPARSVVTATQFAETAHWRTSANANTVATPDGLQVNVDAPEGAAGGAWIQPVDAPDPLPVVSTEALAHGSTLAGLDDRPTPVSQVGRVSALPRLGTFGTLVDLEWADRFSTDAGQARDPQVWLGPAAPADVLSRLAAQGLVVISDQHSDVLRDQLTRQGPILALWFHLAAGWLAIVLAAGGLILIAAVDRRRRGEELLALRVQGLGRRAAGRAVLCTYPALVCVAVLVGLGSAMVAWWLTGWGIPVFVDGRGALPLPGWPRPSAVLLPWLGALVLLTGVALAAGFDLNRQVNVMSRVNLMSRATPRGSRREARRRGAA